jgi:hypothetical protein
MRTASVSSAIGFICTMAVLLAGAGIALGQAGSAGGSVGKTDKSVSGGEVTAPAPKPHHTGAAKPPGKTADTAGSACQRAVGTWTWALGTTTIFRPEGTGKNSSGNTATWTCSDGIFVAKWLTTTGGYLGTDRITPAADGKSLTVNSSLGVTFSAERM